MSGDRRFPDEPVVPCGGAMFLRRHRAGDVPSMLEMCRDPEMQRWTTVPVPYRLEDAEGFLAHTDQSWEQEAIAALAIELDGRFAGNIDLRLEGGSWAEVGYAVAPWARGRGVMTRSLWAALDWGFATLQLEGVHWQAHVGNDASRRVAEKCGFRVEGTVRGLLLQRGRRVDGWIGSVLARELVPRP